MRKYVIIKSSQEKPITNISPITAPVKRCGFLFLIFAFALAIIQPLSISCYNLHSVTSGAVDNILGRMNNNGILTISLQGNVWLKIGEFPNQVGGFILELNIENAFNTGGATSKRLIIMQGAVNNSSPSFYVEEKTASTTTLLKTLRIGYNNNWNDTVCIYLNYNYSGNYSNPFRITFKYMGAFDFTPAFTLSSQAPTERQQSVDYTLHNIGLYINGTKVGG